MTNSGTKYAIIAGTYEQYRNWLKTHNVDPRNAVFANHFYKVAGCRFDRLVKTGTFYELDNLAEIEAYILTHIEGI